MIKTTLISFLKIPLGITISRHQVLSIPSIAFYQQRRFGGDDINGIKAWMINKFQFGPPGGTLCFVLANISQMKSYLEQQSLYFSYPCRVNGKLQSVTHLNDP